MTERSRLAIVYPKDELGPDLPAVFQRTAKRCTVGDANHRGLLALAATFARFAVTSCIPPRARQDLYECIDGAWGWARSIPSPRVKELRARALNALPNAERSTETALAEAIRLTKANERTALDPHADRVALRYATLATYFAGSSVVLALDAIEEPRVVLDLPSQVAGALAYKNAGLGPARNHKLRERAWERAAWEVERGASHQHAEPELAVQLFHEFLGVAWKNHHDSQRLYLWDFIAWALSESPA